MKYKCGALAAALLLAGCAGMNQAMKYDPTVHHVKMPDDVYRIFEYPDHSKVMTTPSLGTAGAAGFIQGATLGLADALPAEQRHEAAARKYLDDTGRAACKLGNGYELIKSQYEFAVDCSSAPSVTPVPSVKPS